MKSLGFLIYFFLLSILSFSQDIKYVRNIIDTLTSEYFAGRGYIDNGINKTADFIESEFKNLNLEQFNNSYKQNFEISINTIEKSVIQNNELIAGYDYLIDVLSSSLKGNFKILKFDKKILSSEDELLKFIKTDNSKKIIWFPLELLKDEKYKELIYSIVYSGLLNTAGVIIETEDYLTNSVHMQSSPISYPIITLKHNNDYLNKIKKLNIEIETKYYEKYPISNVLGYIKGTIHPDSFIVVCAHYDHLGKIGTTIYPGANDNASGISMMLDLAKHYSTEENKLPYSIVFIAFAAEEAGLFGSKYLSENPIFPLSKIRFLLNLDIIGTGKEGIQVVNAKIFKNEFNLLTKINDKNNYLPKIKERGEACNSDHCPFYEKGVSSFFIYALDSTYKYYHVPQDNAKNLPLTAYDNIFKLIVDFFNEVTLKN